MVTDGEIALRLSNQLLQIKAIKIQTANPFQWASGWLSPIY
jgi:orotate phosphoribosyltransferase